MKATAAGYVRAKDLGHAIALLQQSDGDGRVLAGGQSLVPSMNLRLTGEVALVDVNGVAEMQGISVADGVLRLGALTRHRDLGRDPLVAAHAPLLAQAAPLIAHEAIRSRGTLGGSLANADPAAELPACVLALGATLVAAGPDGERRIAAEDFFLGVYTTALDPDEILVAVELPCRAPDEAQVLRELARRSGDYALAGLALVRRAGGHRLACFGLGEVPVLARGAMAALDAGDLAAACDALGGDIDPASDTQASAAYRRHLARVLLRRIVAELDGEDRKHG